MSKNRHSRVSDLHVAEQRAAAARLDEKVAALADPARNPEPHERAVAERMLTRRRRTVIRPVEAKAARPDGSDPRGPSWNPPDPLPAGWRLCPARLGNGAICNRAFDPKLDRDTRLPRTKGRDGKWCSDWCRERDRMFRDALPAAKRHAIIVKREAAEAVAQAHLDADTQPQVTWTEMRAMSAEELHEFEYHRRVYEMMTLARWAEAWSSGDMAAAERYDAILAEPEDGWLNNAE